MQSELAAFPDRVIEALEVKLAIARGQSALSEKHKPLLKWYEKQCAVEYMNAVPRGVYNHMAGRNYKAIEDQVSTVGIPIRAGSDVNLFEVVGWFHTFVGKWGNKIRTGKLEQDRASELSAKKLESEIEKINMQMEAMRIDLDKKRGDSVPIVEIKKSLSWLSNEWRKFGERLGKRFGAESQRMLNDFLEDIEKESVENFPESVDDSVVCSEVDSNLLSQPG